MENKDPSPNKEDIIASSVKPLNKVADAFTKFVELYSKAHYKRIEKASKPREKWYQHLRHNLTEGTSKHLAVLALLSIAMWGFYENYRAGQETTLYNQIAEVVKEKKLMQREFTKEALKARVIVENQIHRCNHRKFTPAQLDDMKEERNNGLVDLVSIVVGLSEIYSKEIQEKAGDYIDKIDNIIDPCQLSFNVFEPMMRARLRAINKDIYASIAKDRAAMAKISPYQGHFEVSLSHGIASSDLHGQFNQAQSDYSSSDSELDLVKE